MIFKFTILSDEAEDFIRIIEIDSEATFFDLHNAILDSAGYEKNQMTSFFLCSDDWEKGQEVTLVEMESSSEYDNLVMEDTQLDELLDDEKQKLLFVFDMISDRAFFMELTEMIPGKDLKKAVVKSATGKAPVQLIDSFDFVPAPQKGAQLPSDENFYGDEDFELDELDEEGFGDLSFDDASLFDDPKS